MSSLLNSGDDLFEVKSTGESTFEKSIAYTLKGVYGNERSFDFLVFKELEDYLPQQTEEEAAEFRMSVLGQGITDPIVLLCTMDDDYVLIDGHHRLRISLEYSIDIKIRVIEDNSYSLSSFIDGSINFEPLKQRILSIQGSRRNLSPDKIKYLRGLLYLSKAKQQGGNTVARTNVAKEIAEQNGVSVGTIYNDAAFAENMDKIRSMNPFLHKAILSGKIKVNKNTLSEIVNITSGTLRSQGLVDAFFDITTTDEFDNFLLSLSRYKAAQPEELPKKKNLIQQARNLDFFDDLPSKTEEIESKDKSFEEKMFSRKPYYMCVYIYSNIRTRPIWESVGLIDFVGKNASKNLLLDVADTDDVVGFFIEKGLDLKLLKEVQANKVYGIIKNDGQVFDLCAFTTIETLSL